VITITVYEDIFDPTKRSQHQVAHVPDARVSDYIPAKLAGGGTAAWLNGGFIRNDDPLVADGDYLHVATPPGGPFAALIPYIVQALVVAIITRAIMQGLMPKEEPVKDNLGGATYSYYGFRNAYRPEGDALPVVYGTMRVAAPCMNQSVTGSAMWGGTGGPHGIAIGVNERLNSMYAVSHGPIRGFGSYLGDVYDVTSFDDLVQYTGSLADNLGFQINGIDGKHIPVVFEWRTGLREQTPIKGLLGSSSLPVTDAGTSYDLLYQIESGTFDISEALKPAGVYSYGGGSPEYIISGDETQYISQLLSTKADICDIQILFEKGLYSGGDTGNYGTESATVRVQYWLTDVTGTSTSDVVLLPAFTVTASILTPFHIDILFGLYDPPTYTLDTQYGYADLKSLSSDWIYNDTALGMAKIRPSSANFDPDLKFTFACFASLHELSATTGNLWLLSWSNSRSYVAPGGPDTAGGGHAFIQTPGYASPAYKWPVGSAYFEIRLHVDTTSDFQFSQSVDPLAVYLIVCAFEANDRAHTPGGTAYAGSWWRTGEPIGTLSGTSTQPSQTEWPEETPQLHISVAYDGTDGGTGGWNEEGTGEGKFQVCIDGVPEIMVKGEPGSTVESWGASYNYNSDRPGFLHTGDDVGNSDNGVPSYLHVPPQFPAGGGGGVAPTNYFSIGTVMAQPTSYPQARSSGAAAQYLLYEGLIGGDFAGVAAWSFLASQTTNTFGQRTYDIRSMMDDPNHASKVRGCFPLDAGDVVDTDKYTNYAYPDEDTMAGGAVEITDVAFTVYDTGGPVWSAAAGTPHTGYYNIEVFKEAPTSSITDISNIVTVDSITTWATQDYDYPGVAYLASSIVATDQVNSNEPNITVICHGKKVKVWDGGSLDVPVFNEEWSNNPAWIAVDLLTNQDYGLGSVFSPQGSYQNIDLALFFEWSRFCDEGVPDAFGDLTFFSLETKYSAGTELGDYRVVLRFGLVDSDGVVQQNIPESWNPNDFQSITAVTGGISGGWTTANDVEDGTNNASNRMLVVSIESFEATTAYHGWSSYLEVECVWNRLRSTGLPIWPEGDTGDSFFADQYNLTSLGSAGQYEKRCTFDGVFDQKERPAWDALIDIMQTGRAMPAKAGNKILPIWDRPRDPIGLFTMANIVEGTLELNYMSPDMNPNSIETEILDADHGYERRSILVDHDSIQDPTGFNAIRKERSQRLGITRRSQAIRDAYYRLNRYALQLRQFKFKVGPDALHLLPGDRVLLSHDVPQYGYSGRLAANAVVVNRHPGAGGLASAWNQNGGNCSISIGSLLVSDATTPPVTGYANAALGYTVPAASDGTNWYPAGELAGNGYNGTIQSTAQMVATADGLYPYAGNEGVPISPLDQIFDEDEIKEFSVYVKEPSYAASEGVKLNIYRYIDAAGAAVKVEYSVLFIWDGSGDLVHSATTGGAAVTYDITEISAGWWRATVFYDNGHASGGGSGAVDDYIQARLSYATSPGSTTWYPSPDGRNNQLWYYGDPLSLDGNLPGTTTKAWTQVNPTAGSPTENSISHSTAVAPPFYPNDTSGDAGKRGYVVRMTNNEAFGAKQPSITQDITLPTDWPDGSSGGDMSDQAICGTIYARIAADNVATNSTLYVRMKTTAGADSDGWLTGDGATLVIPMYGTPSVIEQTTGGTSSWLSSSVAAVRQTSTTDDANWYEINWAWKNSADFGTLYTQIAVAGGTGGGSDPASIEFWGPRIHGAGGTGASTDYVNENAHRGTIMWGPLYNAGAASTTTPTVWNDGATFTLDRDVTLDAGNSYEIYLRSTYSPDTMTGSDVTTRVLVAQSEVPAASSTTKAAGTGIKTTAPEGMAPVTGDVYSFGKLDNSVEDMVVTDITLDAVTLEREITGIEYVEAIYNDTAFGTMGDLTISDLMPPSAGGSSAQYGFGGTGPNGDSFSLSVTTSPYRTPNAEAQAALTIVLNPARGVFPYKECRLWISELSDSKFASEPRHIATLPYAVQSYRYADSGLDPARVYRIYAQRVGWRGTGPPIQSSPHHDVRPVVTPPIPSAPTLEVDVDGFEQLYRTAPAQDGKVSTIEARVGGWIISSPGFVVNPEDRKFTSRGIAVGATNAAGETNFPVYCRASLANGKFGVATEVTTSSTFVDARSTDTKIAEDDFSNIMSVPTDLQVAAGVLQWDETGPSTALGPVDIEMDEFDLGAAKRAIPTAMIQGVQHRPETLADLNFALGSETGRRWSIEGPMDDQGATAENASVKIEWRWTSGSSLLGESYVPFESQEVYFRKCQFKLVWTRPTADYQVKLSRFVVKIYVPPLFDPSDVDGGTF
jgi:hypothetical protein